MDRIYKEMPAGDIPWNMETPPEILRSVAENRLSRPCKVIEMGCGAGNYVIYFSKLGFDATGVDISGNAVAIARKSAADAGSTCRFIVADVLGDLPEIVGAFDFAYDWELLHHIYPEDREKYVRNVDRLLVPGGRYLSVCFSEADPQFGGVGKYRKTGLGTVLYFSSEAELASLFRKRFRIEELNTVDIAGKHAVHKAVCAWMKKGDP
jgi:SAM-dependent methyltransferase